MSHFGIITPPVSGHLHPFAALGRELIARGHRVTCFQVVDLAKRIEAEDIEFRPIGERDHPAGSLQRSLDELGQLQGQAALKFTIRAVAKTSEMVCRDAPSAIRAASVDALLVDQMEPAGGAVAEHLGLPFVTICNALTINREPAVPPPFSPWQFRDTWWARLRNRAGYAAGDWATRAITEVVGRHRRAWKLPPLDSPERSFSTLAQICQMPAAFDFPRTGLGPTFHYVGPIRRSNREVPFPWDRLNGQPLVYASLGTLQNSREPVFRCFAEACAGLDVQLVISHGGGLTNDQVASLPGTPLVVPYAPQQELLAKAALTVTHAGLNTVLDSLAQGVPLVTLPITYEQPAIARRVERIGAGLTVPFSKLSARRLRQAVVEVLGDPRRKASAAGIAEASRKAGGVGRAATLVESATGLRI